MGRESRQARRARERRELERRSRQQHHHTSISNKWSLLAGAAIAVVVAGALLSYFFSQTSSVNAVQATATAAALSEDTPVPGMAVGNVQCTANEMVSPGFYHVHAHLTILDQGKSVPIDNNIGFTNQGCLYWVHTHNPSNGILHIETPYKLVPTLGQFFRIWKKPLSSSQVGKVKVRPGDQIRTFVNGKRYTGDPRSIPLVAHQDIVIEVGPPFVKTKPFPFAKYNV